MADFTILGYSLGEIFVVITAIVFVANLITMMTPTKADDKVVDMLLTVMNFLALNVFKNKNADTILTMVKSMRENGYSDQDIVKSVETES